jgi:DNA polymerase III subunit gamma/tau
MKFSDLVGQENVALALGNALRLGREPHGVIFSGIRGVGKTTTARLYAKALNCSMGKLAEPCGTCENCDAIARGCHEDVFEIDGASNNGVDEIRSLRETVMYAPQRGKFRVYIIDEVHMLSASAFNALLKTLEEPPSHVVFIMATTEIHKVPLTISSRCLTFHLQKMRPKTIVERAALILKQENIPFEEKALWLVAREGHGSMRDALTFLDQAIALGSGKVTVDTLKNMVTTSSLAAYIGLLEYALERNAKAILDEIAKFDASGIQAKDYIGELATLSRHGLIIRTLGIESPEIQSLGLEEGELTRLKLIANSAKDFDLNRLFRSLIKCLSDLDGSAMDRFISENYLLEWCFDPGLPSIEDLRKGNFNFPKQATHAGTTISSQAQPTKLRQESPQPKTSITTPLGKDSNTVLNTNPPASNITSTAVKGKVDAKNFSKGMKEALASSSSNLSTPQSKEPLMASQNLDSLPTKLSLNESTFGNQAQVTKTIETVGHSPVAEHSPIVQQTPNVAQTTLENKVSSTRSTSETISDTKKNSNRESILAIPNNWGQLVETWKTFRPLQARKLEDVVPLDYSPTLIRIGVRSDSLVGQSLLQKDGMLSLKQELQEIFSFAGELVIETYDGAKIGETLLDVKEREIQDRKDRLKNEALESQLVKHMTKVFDAPVLQVRVADSPQTTK